MSKQKNTRTHASIAETLTNFGNSFFFSFLKLETENCIKDLISTLKQTKCLECRAFKKFGRYVLKLKQYLSSEVLTLQIFSPKHTFLTFKSSQLNYNQNASVTVCTVCTVVFAARRSMNNAIQIQTNMTIRAGSKNSEIREKYEKLIITSARTRQ